MQSGDKRCHALLGLFMFLNTNFTKMFRCVEVEFILCGLAAKSKSLSVFVFSF